MTDTIQAKLTIIGAGPGGYAAAFFAADIGMDVTLIDREDAPGGVCLYRGCIPSKTLLHVSRTINDARSAKECGVTFAEPQIDLDKLREWKRSVVSRLAGGLSQLCKQRKINYVQGDAVFTGPRSLTVRKPDGTDAHVASEYTILATGSRPAMLPNLVVDSPHLFTSAKALDIPSVPTTLLVVGGGYIGLELGSVYAALGSKVTVVEMTSGLLPGADRDLVNFLARRLKGQFARILLDTSVAAVKDTPEGMKVTFKAEGADGKTEDVHFDAVLIAVGRKPNSGGLGLEKTAVKVDERGFVKVNGQRQTDDPSIYAVGDITGNPMLAHKASHEGRVAVESIAGLVVEFAPKAIPAVIFTDPEIAWCGLSETEAAAGSRNVKIARFPWAASGRATTMGRSDGMTKLIIDPDDERILGAGICGPGAGELIAEGVLAVEMGATVTDLRLCIHPHPTLSETVMEAAEVFFGQSTHLYRPAR